MSFPRTMMVVAISVLGLSLSCGGDDEPAVDSGTDAPADSSMDTGADTAPPDAGDAGTGRPEMMVPACTPSGTGMTYTFVVDQLDIAYPSAADPTIMPGFDLDGRVSDDTDPGGCFKTDFSSGPPDDREGVDSQIGVALFELGADDSVTGDIRDGLASGGVLILIEITDVDDLTDDECVHVTIREGVLPPAVAAPMLDAEGRYVPGQTFDIARRSVAADDSPQFRYEAARIEGGRLIGRATTPVDLFFAVDDPPLLTTLHFSEVTMNVASDRLTGGILGGGIDIADTLERNMAIIDDPAVIMLTLDVYSDLWPLDGSCTGISYTQIFEAVPAVLGDVVDT